MMVYPINQNDLGFLLLTDSSLQVKLLNILATK